MISAPILVSVLTLSFLTTLTNSHFIHNFCESTKYHFNWRSDQSNLKLLLSSLILNTPKTGFSTGTEGQLPNRVYGLGLYRGDTSDDDCTSCLNTASDHLLELCRYPKGGMVWYNHCAVRYSTHNFFSQLPADTDYSGSVALCTQDGPPNPDQFKKNLIYLLQYISRIAVFNESARMFATGVINAQTYMMVQCTRDLSNRQCFECLNYPPFASFFQNCGTSGYFFRWNCMMMYSRGKHFDSDLTWVAPPDHDYRLNNGNSNIYQLGDQIQLPERLAYTDRCWDTCHERAWWKTE